MIVDAILFNDELELLRQRISWLRDYVDVTIILEAEFTFSGRPKSLIAKSKLTELIDLTEGKLILLQMTDETFNGNLPNNPWKIECESREFLVEHLVVNYPESRVLFADLDEIPSLEQMRFISELDLNGNLETFSIPMQVYYRYANWQLLGSGENWNLAKTFNSSFAPAVSEIRSSDKFANLPGKGSHLSYLAMTTQQITNKFEAFSHSELTGFRNIEAFFTRISDFYFVDHIGRFDVKGRGLIRVLNENQVEDVCEYFVKSESKYFKHGITPPTLKRLAASALITYLRKSKDSPKGLFHKFVGMGVKRNKPSIGIFSSLVILTHSYFMVSIRDMSVFLKQMIPKPIKSSIKKLV